MNTQEVRLTWGLLWLHVAMLAFFGTMALFFPMVGEYWWGLLMLAGFVLETDGVMWCLRRIRP